MKSTAKHKNKKTKKPLRRRKGCLIIIGGSEDKGDDRPILTEVARRAGQGTLIVVTAATQLVEDHWDDYRKVFKELGVKNIEHLHITQTEDARNPAWAKIFKDASCVFFTGGDQLRITTKLGGTPIMDFIFEVYESGGTIAGTSAGASVMGKTMLIGTDEDSESHKVGNWMMAPGFGFLDEIIIDQHFAQRARIGRLLGAVGQNPGVLGVGIDEDTAIIVENNEFKVLGSNAVYVIDGYSVTSTNVAEASAEKTMSMHNITLHILAEGEKYNFHERKIVSRAPKD